MKGATASLMKHPVLESRDKIQARELFSTSREKLEPKEVLALLHGKLRAES